MSGSLLQMSGVNAFDSFLNGGGEALRAKAERQVALVRQRTEEQARQAEEQAMNQLFAEVMTLLRPATAEAIRAVQELLGLCRRKTAEDHRRRALLEKALEYACDDDVSAGYGERAFQALERHLRIALIGVSHLIEVERALAAEDIAAFLAAIGYDEYGVQADDQCAGAVAAIRSLQKLQPDEYWSMGTWASGNADLDAAAKLAAGILEVHRTADAALADLES
jgi:hypothetical protein